MPAPNIIFMVADNLGRESVGYYGDHIFETPRMDALASEGVIFDNCLIATPLCAPARCGWNTGRCPYRVGINTQTKPGDPESGISSEEITLATLLKGAGYDTALFGKWNLGYHEKHNPLHHGFDTFYGSMAGNADYYTHVYRDLKTHFYRGLDPIQDEGYFDQLFTDEAIHYLQTRKDNPNPFYLNLTFYAPHGPYQAPPGYYHNTEKNYQYMIEYLDACVGRVVDEVDRLGMAENTLIVFLSDQGGSHINNYGRTLQETGLKVVCNARWKGSIPEGSRVQTPWMHLDVYTTFAKLAGASIPQDRVIDAVDIWPLFEGREMDMSDRAFHWTYQTRQGRRDVIRICNLKLHLLDGNIHQLFDLASDPEETTNILQDHTEQANHMADLHRTWKTECEAKQTSKA